MSFKRFLLEKEKVSQESVDYSPGMKTSHCGICEHYIEPHACEKVKGDINPSYWCKLFKKG